MKEFAATNKTRSASHTAQNSFFMGQSDRGMLSGGSHKYQSSLEATGNFRATTSNMVPPIAVPTERSHSVMNGTSYTSGFSNSLMKNQLGKVMSKPQQQEAFFAYIATRPEVNSGMNIQSL